MDSPRPIDSWPRHTAESICNHLLVNTLNGIWVIDTAGKTDFVNARMASILGYSESELMSEPNSIDCRTSSRAAQISQVLLNNAFDAVSGTAGAWLELSVSEEPDWIQFAVEDSGDGISAEIRATMFQPFFTTKEVGKGTGLGLRISMGIMQGHRGALTLDENLSRTRLLLRLPKALTE